MLFLLAAVDLCIRLVGWASRGVAVWCQKESGKYSSNSGDF